MRAEAILLLVLASFQAANSLPDIPFRGFVVESKEYGKAINGNARLSIDGEKITNITTTSYMTKGNCTVDITDGGVGYSYVSISVNVTADTLGAFYMYILTTELSDISQVLQQSSPVSKDDSQYFIFDYSATYTASNSSRGDVVSFSFDEDVTLCTGRSLWYNGNGTGGFLGGAVDNDLVAAFTIPKGISGDSMCGCYYSGDGIVDSGSIRAMDRLPAGNGDGVVFGQEFETFGYSTTPFSDRMVFELLLGYEILSYEGGVHWRNGTGQYNITTAEGDGNLGWNIHVDIQSSAYSYGYVFVDYLIKWLD